MPEKMQQMIERNRSAAPGSGHGLKPACFEQLEPRTLLAAAPPTLVRDPSFAGTFVETPEKTFFIESQTTLHVTNGTAGGTFALKTFGKVGGMRAFGSDVYLTTDTGVWRSDGTAAGTVNVLPMYRNIDGMARANGFAELGGEIYFYARLHNGPDGSWQSGLWKTDGTPGNASLVRRIAFADSLTRVGDTLFFVGDDEQGTGKELWKTDGTAGGTVLVKDIHPTHGGMWSGGGDGAMTAVGDTLVFRAYDGTSSYHHLWSSDGTEAGTVKISDARPGDKFTLIGGAAYFGAGSAAGTGELWKTDGTSGGTSLVKDLGTLSASQWLGVGNTLYFAGRDGEGSASLWKSNGTTAGTVRVAGPAEGKPFGSIFGLNDADGTVAFIAADPAVISGAYSLWTSDGTTAGTLKVRDTFTSGMTGSPGNVGVAGSVALFTANDGVGAAELWAFQTANPPPLPEARAVGPAPYAVAEGATVPLHGYTTATPLPDRPLTYAWDLDGDGVFGETGPGATRGAETGTDPTLNAAGLDGPSTHTVRFRISDSTGHVSTDAADVTIRNQPPTLNVTGGPSVLVQGNAYTLNLSTADGGPDTVTEWVIDWGDGVTQTLPGSATSATHAYPLAPATYGITVIARDEDGEYRFDRPAAFDIEFGADGVVQSSGAEPEESPGSVVVQRDGKTVTVSTLQLSAQQNDQAIAVSRYLPDGTLDPTFGVGGRVQFNTGYASGTSAGAVAVQPDGRIVVAGSTGPSISSNALVMRLLPDGSFDPSFGAGGWVTYDFGQYDHLAQVGIKQDGRIVVSGIANWKLLLAQLKPDGSLDAGFGTGGSIIVDDVSANAGGVRGMAIQPDGKLVVLPYGYPPLTSFLVMRFNEDGSPDASFDGDGRATVDFEYGSGVGTGLALAPDGTILISGSTPSSPDSPQPGGNDAVVARLTSTGALDATFADAGRLRIVPAGPFDSSESLQGMALPIVRVLADGRFVLAGSHELYQNRWQYLVDRYHADGTADTSFAPGGRFVVDVGGTGIDAWLRDIVLQPDGAPVLYGGAGTAHNATDALVRLTPPGLSVRVVDAGQPQVSISAPPTTSEAATYTLGLSASDSDGDGITQWIINWGDGSVQVVDGNPSSVTHVYADGPRDVVIKASAMDGDRSIASISADVDVANEAPTITVTGGAPAAEGSPYTVEFSATDVGTDTITHWTIDWGDGKSSTLSANATSAQHVYMDDGDYPVTVRAIDEDGTFPAAPVTAEITNVPPTLDPIGDRVAAAAGNFQLTFTARDVVPELFSGTIDWGDGSEDTPFAAATAAAVGSLAVNHVYAARGTYTVTVNLTDGDGGTATGTASVRVGDVVVRVFDDTNGNGVRDGADVARGGVTAFLDLDRDGALDAGEPAATTDAFGDAPFDDVPPGTHAARIVLPPRWHLTAPAAGFVDVTRGTASAVATFGLSQNAAVSGTLYHDPNTNGVRDEGEIALALAVRARRVDTNTSVTVLADQNGVYRFTGLPPGQYLIEFPNNTRVITEPAGRRGRLVTITGAESEFTGLDIGSIPGTGATVSGTLYRDVNGNGTFEAGEPPVPSQLVYIDVNDNGAREPDELVALTNSSGGWTIPRLPGGTYRVRQVLPPGSPAANDPAVSRQVTVALGQTLTGIDLARPYERTYYVRRSGDNVVVYNGSQTNQSIVSSTPATSANPFTVSLSGADDWVIVDWTFGNPVPAGGLHLDGLGGAGDTLSVVGTTGADAVTFAARGITLGGAHVSHAGIERITFDGNGGVDEVTVTGGPPVTLNSPEDLAPRVTDVFIGGTSWSAAFRDFLAASGQGDTAFGYRVPADGQLNELPWTNLNRVSVRFSEGVNVTADDLVIRGVNVGQYANLQFAYDAARQTATWTLPTGMFFAADKLVLDLDGDAGGVTDASGNRLDGEWSNPTAPAVGGADAFPSGNGTAGGDFRFRLNVLPGDVNGTGSILGSDVTLVRNAQGSEPGFGLYTVFKDVNGTGSILGSDVTLVRNRQGLSLPEAEPVGSPTAEPTIAQTAAAVTTTTSTAGRSALFASGTRVRSAVRVLAERFDLLGDELDLPLLA